MHFYEIITVFIVGTPFMASGDSSPCIEMDRGSKPIETSQGDESPDAINGVPTVLWRDEFVKLHQRVPTPKKTGLSSLSEMDWAQGRPLRETFGRASFWGLLRLS